MTILSVTPENQLLWAFLMENFNLGIAKMSVISESGTSENLCSMYSIKQGSGLNLGKFWKFLQLGLKIIVMARVKIF